LRGRIHLFCLLAHPSPERRIYCFFLSVTRALPRVWLAGALRHPLLFFPHCLSWRSGASLLLAPPIAFHSGYSFFHCKNAPPSRVAPAMAGHPHWFLLPPLSALVSTPRLARPFFRVGIPPSACIAFPPPPQCGLSVMCGDHSPGSSLEQSCASCVLARGSTGLPPLDFPASLPSMLAHSGSFYTTPAFLSPRPARSRPLSARPHSFLPGSQSLLPPAVIRFLCWSGLHPQLPLRPDQNLFAIQLFSEMRDPLLQFFWICTRGGSPPPPLRPRPPLVPCRHQWPMFLNFPMTFKAFHDPPARIPPTRLGPRS